MIVVFLHTCESDCDNKLRIEFGDGIGYVLPTLHRMSKMNRARESDPFSKENATQYPLIFKKGCHDDDFSADNDPALFDFLRY